MVLDGTVWENDDPLTHITWDCLGKTGTGRDGIGRTQKPLEIVPRVSSTLTFGTTISEVNLVCPADRIVGDEHGPLTVSGTYPILFSLRSAFLFPLGSAHCP